VCVGGGRAGGEEKVDGRRRRRRAKADFWLLERKKHENGICAVLCGCRSKG